MTKFEAITRLSMALRREHEAIAVLHQVSVEAGNLPTINLTDRFIDGIRRTMETFDVITDREWNDAVNRGDILE